MTRDKPAGSGSTGHAPNLPAGFCIMGPEEFNYYTSSKIQIRNGQDRYPSTSERLSITTFNDTCSSELCDYSSTRKAILKYS
jgi:hypothetical protein